MAAISLPAQIVRTRRFTLGVPGQFTVAPDGASVLFLRSPAGHDPLTCLWSLDLASGTERLLAAGIASYATDATATLAAFTLGGALWTVSVATGQARRLPARSPVTDPRPDPAGLRIAYLSRGALRVIEADGAADRALMAPDDPDVTFGTEDLTAATSLTGPRGYLWAPDGPACWSPGWMPPTCRNGTSPTPPTPPSRRAPSATRPPAPPTTRSPSGSPPSTAPARRSAGT